MNSKVWFFGLRFDFSDLNLDWIQCFVQRVSGNSRHDDHDLLLILHGKVGGVLLLWQMRTHRGKCLPHRLPLQVPLRVPRRVRLPRSVWTLLYSNTRQVGSDYVRKGRGAIKCKNERQRLRSSESTGCGRAKYTRLPRSKELAPIRLIVPPSVQGATSAWVSEKEDHTGAIMVWTRW